MTVALSSRLLEATIESHVPALFLPSVVSSAFTATPSPKRPGQLLLMQRPQLILMTH